MSYLVGGSLYFRGLGKAAGGKEGRKEGGGVVSALGTPESGFGERGRRPVVVVSLELPNETRD